jgi:hypothetical protein
MRTQTFSTPRFTRLKSSFVRRQKNEFYKLEQFYNDLFEGQPLRMQFCSTESQITFFCFLTTIWKNFATALFHALRPLTFRATVKDYKMQGNYENH